MRLRKRNDNHLCHTISMKTKIVGVGILLACLAASSLAYLLPVAGDQVAWMVQSRTAVGILISSLSFGAAWWFLSALSGFTKDLRIAYRLLVMGVVLFGIGLLQLPVISLFNLWDTWYVFWGVILLPSLVSVALMYSGLRKFGRILNLRSRFMSWRILMLTTAVFIAVMVPAAHFLTRFPAEGLEVYHAVLMWCLAAFLFCAGLASRIRQNIGKAYKDAMRFMSIVMIAYAVAILQECLANIVFDPNGPYAETGAELLAFAVAGFLSLEAGRRFYLITAPVASEALSKVSPEEIADNDYVESILRIAELASVPGDIDPILDSLREITATRHPGIEKALSGQERERLMNTYHQLESYLLSKEPVRRLTAADIRDRVTPAFRALLASDDQTNSSVNDSISNLP